MQYKCMFTYKHLETIWILQVLLEITQGKKQLRIGLGDLVYKNVDLEWDSEEFLASQWILFIKS